MSDLRGTSRDRRDTEALAQVVAEHLPSGYTAEFDSTAGSTDGATPASAEGSDVVPIPEEESSLKLQGGDMHRDLFRLPSAATRVPMHRRAATFHSPRDLHPDDDAPPLTVGDQLAPGGFRRAFLHQRHGNDFMAARLPITRNFVEFLDLYGSFAGEDLVDTDEEAVTEEEEEQGEGVEEEMVGERRPLLRQRISSVRTPRSANAGTVKTFFTLLKAFIGTGIMFLPKAFRNGGILFSTVSMLSVSAVTMVAFHLLLQCKLHHGGGYGDIGNAIAGPRMRTLILFSIALSQLGFVCAGIVFVAENLETFFHAVTGGQNPFTSAGLIAMQLIILDSPLVNSVQLLYAIAVLVGTPVQLFPALRILEGKIFGHMRSGKGSLRTKWVKNLFRVGVVVFCGLVSVAGTGNLDRFVALIGSVACVPLVYVYPAFLHYRGVATQRTFACVSMMMICATLVVGYPWISAGQSTPDPPPQLHKGELIENVRFMGSSVLR
ncbi:hypothetical protein CHGG_08380 [Chaetomium globosum CBS 148.51]|uniref:Amino acid transporter transmembrane domain-containing protein n=1 Tax=Chaetomium globosum (strain ATCC 6205 / CBS 148.51 / DSM 1962 / NBRC 6347 / NRRL 1970) TaxID=306901 RepID=Q2GUH4_CHAGB|nr:uncharacterized protein CHGG_08380 [Chaetomium globosum CBS 148.51]EAQ84366.1 hypothetical protein CHGG_08380 [Chaetomium globosum CBS 148.51]